MKDISFHMTGTRMIIPTMINAVIMIVDNICFVLFPIQI